MADRGRPAKRVIDHIAAGTFRMSKHGHLVDDEFPELRDFGERYAAATTEAERRAIKDELMAAIEARSQLESMEQFMYATLGLSPDQLAAYDHSYASFDAYYRAWRLWDATHGLPWRVRHACLHNRDKELLHQLVAEDAADLDLPNVQASFEERVWLYINQDGADGLVNNVKVLDEQLDDLLAAYREDYAEAIAGAPDPPGWELVS